MQLQTIFNRVERNKSFIYGQPRFVDEAPHLRTEVRIEARANSWPVCSGCGQSRPGYDRLQPRRYELIPVWQIAVVFVDALRRVDCPSCGVVVERIPWSNGKSGLTTVDIAALQSEDIHVDAYEQEFTSQSTRKIARSSLQSQLEQTCSDSPLR